MGIEDRRVGESQAPLLDDYGAIDRAMAHSRESIRYEEIQGNLYGAAQTRFNVAFHLANARRLVDSRDYARAASRNFKTYGDAAADQIQKTERFLAQIETAQKSE